MLVVTTVLVGVSNQVLYHGEKGKGRGRGRGRGKGGSTAKQQQEIAADFNYPKNREFAVRNAMRDCGSMTVPQLRTCIRILRETDKSCKSTRTAPRLLLEQAVVRMLKDAGVSDSRISYSSVGSDKDAAASPASNRVAVCIVK